MKTGFSLCSFSHREKPVFITWEHRNENRFFPVWIKYTGKPLIWPCTGPVQDCSVLVTVFIFQFVIEQEVSKLWLVQLEKSYNTIQYPPQICSP